MAESSADIVIVGGGIAGMTTAYYLAKSGVPSVVVERDAIGSHASGFAYGGLSPLSGFGIPGPLAEMAQDGMRLHRELSKSLLEETGIDVDFRVRSSLALAFTEADVRRLRAALLWQQEQPGYTVRWLDIAEARRGIGLDRRADRGPSAQGPDPPPAGSRSAGRMFRRLGPQLRHDQDRRPLVGGDHRGRGRVRRGVDARGPRRDRRCAPEDVAG